MYVYLDRPTGEVSSCYRERQESWQKLGTEYSFETTTDIVRELSPRI